MTTDVAAIEFRLQGGRMTPDVVRVGKTVRRPRASNWNLVQDLLRHLDAAGFEGAPRWLGTDDAGREIFSFLDGEVPAELGLFDDKALVAAASLIRMYHDLTTELVGSCAAIPQTEVLCHNDLSPCNFVFRNGKPVAIIDFDAAAPGTRSSDLGYAAWLWLDIGNPDLSATEQSRRLQLFVGSYGRLPAEAVLVAIMARQASLAAEALSREKAAMSEWAATCLAWTRRNATELVGFSPEA